MNTSLLLLTIISLVVAAAASVMAWQVNRENARRAEARIAALSTDIHGPGAFIMREAEPHPRSEGDDSDVGLARAPGMRLAPSYAWLIATASALVLFAAGLTLTTWRPSATDRPAAARVSSSSSTDTALELVTLSHTATKDGLLVTGRIHNPDRASARRDLSVVVLLFDAQGLFLGSAQTDAGEPRLEPGASTTFAVAVPSRMAAARYRVSFRQGDAVVPHVDKRGDPKAATSTSARGAPAGVRGMS